MLYRAIQ